MAARHELAGSLTFLVPDFRWEERIGAIISLAVHVVAAVLLFKGVGQKEEVVIQRVVFDPPRPILQKSFELAKRPEISEVQMEMLQSIAMTPDVQLSQDMYSTSSGAGGGVGLVGGVPTSLGAMSREGLEGMSGSKAMAPAVEQVNMVELAAAGVPKQEALSLSQELLNVQDLDIGRYQAIIIPDPTNKKNIRGYLNMTIIDYDVADKNKDRFPTAAEELMRYMRDNTQVKAQIEGTTLELSDPRIMNAPFLYMTGDDATLRISSTEKTNLGEYLRSGGFLFAEDIRHADATNGLDGKGAGTVGTPFDRQFKDLMRDPLVLGSDGDKWEKMPKSHPIYASFYDFPDGPPLGGAPGGNVFDLEMLRLRGRVAVVFSDLNISYYWGDPLADAKERGLQFGINLIIFALTQAGGIANVSQFAQ
ncbi:MAG: DUF4159 domain-containing protein [Candidatus Latescibacterota bacterium]